MPAWAAVVFIAVVIVAGVFGLVRNALRPAHDPDALVLERLSKAGSDLAQMHQVEFFLLFESADSAEGAARELNRVGYSTGTVPSSARWMCQASRHLVPTLLALQEARRELTALAQRFGGAYDGWGAAIVPSETDAKRA